MHFYTTNAAEATVDMQNGWTLEGIACYVFQNSGPLEFHRLFNSGNGDHLYTTNLDEVISAIDGGYKDEGAACYVYQYPPDESQPPTENFYRRHNPSTGEHFYTASQAEASAVLQEGFVDEGISRLVFSQEQAPANTVPLYRLFLP